MKIFHKSSEWKKKDVAGTQNDKRNILQVRQICEGEGGG